MILPELKKGEANLALFSKAVGKRLSEKSELE
jgi:hypothetical protein